jgi:hypothetical protein
VLVVVLAALSAYVYFFTTAQDASLPEAQERVFPGLEAGDIQEVHVTSEAGDRTTVRKEGETWQVVAPTTVPASTSEITNLTSALGRLELTRVVEENPSDLEPYGLAKPRADIDFKSAEGKTSGRLLVGNKTPTGASLYAKRGDQPRVFLIAAYLDGSLNRSTFDLRDKAIVKIDTATVDAVEVNTGGRVVELKKDNNEWMLVNPVAARADNGTVDAMVRRVETVQMKSIVTEQASPADLKQFGLERPDVTVTFHAGSAQATVSIGGNAGEDAVYVKDASRPVVMTVDRTLVDDLRKEAEEFRRRDVFEFRPYDTARVEFTRDGQTTAFEHTEGDAENPQGSWRRVSPSTADVEAGKMEVLLGTLVDMRATSFLPSTANTGLDAPVMTVFARFEGGKKEERVTLGRSGSDVYASRPDQPGALKIEGAKLDETIKSLDELSK